MAVLDGFTGKLHFFSARTGKATGRRSLDTAGGARWHFAGYNQASHFLYLVLETDKRKVLEALKIDIVKNRDETTALPGLTEAVGVNYNPVSDQVYIPYDNHPTVHLVDFAKGGKLEEIAIPSYGNDASAVDLERNLLYVSSWAYGDIEVIDLETRRFKKRIAQVGIIPHMFNMTYSAKTRKLYIPLGAGAVNGSFGAALTVLDPETGKKHKVYSGWAPVDLASFPGQDAFLVFNSEDEYAEVHPNGHFNRRKLPFDYPHDAVVTKNGNICLSYGPHQSYWPVVYIWAAKNGILHIDAENQAFYDRRIPRLAHRIVIDKQGALYGLQNNWGGEKQFLFCLPDEVRSPNQGDMRIELEDRVLRETTQRILEYDPGANRLYLCRTGEMDEDPGIIQVIDPEKKKTIFSYPTGKTPVDLVFNDSHIYIANFDDDTVTAIDKRDLTVAKMKTGKQPVKMVLHEDTLYVINHSDNTLQSFGEESRTAKLPVPGKPGNIIKADKILVITSHTGDALHITGFSLDRQAFFPIHREAYPYGEATLDTNNSAFYVRGQFGDCIFELNRIKVDGKGRVWITDYLSGTLFILSPR